MSNLPEDENSVRQRLVMIEQAVKLALQPYQFQPNDANTWAGVASSLTNYLTGLWTQGRLVGSSASSAFSVAVGLGRSMTADDILQGILRVSVQVALVHPAEFITVTVEQQMQSS